MKLRNTRTVSPRPHGARPVVVAAERRRKAAALVAGGVALTLLGSGGTFALLSETHTVTQNITAGGNLGLRVDGETSGIVTLDDMSGMLPGQSADREILIENIGAFPVRVSLTVRDGSPDGDDRSDALDELTTVTVTDHMSVLLSDAPEHDDAVEPQVPDLILLEPGDETIVNLAVAIASVDAATWAPAALGSTSAIIEITGTLATDEEPADDADDEAAMSGAIVIDAGHGWTADDLVEIPTTENAPLTLAYGIAIDLSGFELPVVVSAHHPFWWATPGVNVWAGDPFIRMTDPEFSSGPYADVISFGVFVDRGTGWPQSPGVKEFFDIPDSQRSLDLDVQVSAFRGDWESDAMCISGSELAITVTELGGDQRSVNQSIALPRLWSHSPTACG